MSISKGRFEEPALFYELLFNKVLDNINLLRQCER